MLQLRALATWLDSRGVITSGVSDDCRQHHKNENSASAGNSHQIALKMLTAVNIVTQLVRQVSNHNFQVGHVIS